MAAQDGGGKEDSIWYSTDEARDTLGPLVLRAGYGNERIRISYHGEPMAALIGLKDLERLEALDAA